MTPDELADAVAAELNSYFRARRDFMANADVIDYGDYCSVLVQCREVPHGGDSPVEIGIEEGAVSFDRKDAKFDFIERAIIRSLKKASTDTGYVGLKRL